MALLSACGGSPASPQAAPTTPAPTVAEPTPSPTPLYDCGSRPRGGAATASQLRAELDVGPATTHVGEALSFTLYLSNPTMRPIRISATTPAIFWFTGEDGRVLWMTAPPTHTPVVIAKTIAPGGRTIVRTDGWDATFCDPAAPHASVAKGPLRHGAYRGHAYFTAKVGGHTEAWLTDRVFSVK